MSPYRSDGVYLLHFDTPYKHAQHYLGWSNRIISRFATHRAGRGVPLTQAAYQAGIGMHLARRWYGYTKAGERALRNRHNNRLLCPVCNPHAYRERLPKGAGGF